MSNQSRVTEFILHGFSDIQEMRTFQFISFLIIYLVATMENFLIITVIMNSHLLHKPMYFFLVNLAFQDLGSISVTIPKSMANSLMNTSSISYSGCVSQVFFFLFFTSSHFLLLGVMAYDRYVAICSPLQYENVMNRKACIKMATGAWSGGLFYSTVHTTNAFIIEFCSNEIHQFFCEIPQLFKNSCSNSYSVAFWVLSVAVFLAFMYLASIIYSYIQIFRTVLRIPSTQGKQKAFSTCLPHLIVIILYLMTGSFAYLQPISKSSTTKNILISMSYCMLPPVMNPLMYSMRNKELKITFWKLAANFFPQFLHNDHWPVRGIQGKV